MLRHRPSVPAGPSPLLAPDEPSPVRVSWHEPRRPALLACDHASHLIPRALAGLGLPEAARTRHIAWDIGAAELTEALAARLGLPAVLAGYSRLVIDCNRPPEDPSSILEVSDGQTMPGNVGLDAAAREARAGACFRPYHRAIEEMLAELCSLAPAPALMAVHSFTPRMQGVERRWHCGVLWNRDRRMPLPLMAALRTEPGLVVGDNEPYSGRNPADYTVGLHAERRGWPHVCIEVRQDLLATPEGVGQWADRLARALEPILDERSLYHAVRLEPDKQGGG